jgi:signal peptidase
MSKISCFFRTDSPAGRVASIALKVVSWTFLVIAAAMMVFTIVSVTTFDRADRGVFGYKMFIVLSDSMKATDFRAGDLVVSKAIKDKSVLKPGDIITFQSTDPDNLGEIITHKIRKKTTDSEGNPGFITYGTTTGVDDETIVTYDMVLGKYQFRIPKAGKFFRFLKTTPGYIVCILIPFLFLIGIQGFNTVMAFRQYKKEQLETLRQEKEELAKERAKTEALMSELLAMKSEIEAMKSKATSENKDGENP